MRRSKSFRRGKKMSPIIGTVINTVMGRLIHKKKVDSTTNFSTATGIPMAMASAAMMIQDQDPVVQMMGAVLALISAILVVWKDEEDAK